MKNYYKYSALLLIALFLFSCNKDESFTETETTSEESELTVNAMATIGSGVMMQAFIGMYLLAEHGGILLTVSSKIGAMQE